MGYELVHMSSGVPDTKLSFIELILGFALPFVPEMPLLKIILRRFSWIYTNIYVTNPWGCILLYSMLFIILFCCCCLVTESCPTLAFPCTISLQAMMSMGFFRQEYWSGSPFPSPLDNFSTSLIKCLKILGRKFN